MCWLLAASVCKNKRSSQWSPERSIILCAEGVPALGAPFCAFGGRFSRVAVRSPTPSEAGESQERTRRRRCSYWLWLSPAEFSMAHARSNGPAEYIAAKRRKSCRAASKRRSGVCAMSFRENLAPSESRRALLTEGDNTFGKVLTSACVTLGIAFLDESLFVRRVQCNPRKLSDNSKRTRTT